MADNTVTIGLVVDARQLSNSLQASKKKFSSFRGQLKKQFKSMGSSFRSALSFAGIGGLGGLAIAGKQVLDFQRQLLNLGVRAKLSNAEMSDLEKAVFKVGKATAKQPEELLAGAMAFQELTGQAREFIGGMEDAARISTATGASMEDVARTQAALFQNLGITAAEMGQAFDLMARGADKGAIEFRDFATLTQGLTAQFKIFGKDGLGGINELQGLLQVTRRGFGDASQAATGLSGVMTALIRNQDKFEKAGVKLFENGKRRGLKAVLDDLAGKGFSDKKLVKMFGRVEGFKAFKTISDPKNAKAFDDITNSQAATNFVLKDFNRIIESTPAKMDRAKVKMKEAFNKALADNIDGIATAMEGIASAISFIADNPKTAAAMAVIAKLAQIFIGAKLASGSRGRIPGGGGDLIPGNTKVGKGGIGKFTAGAAAVPALGLGVAAGLTLNDFLDSQGVGPKSLLPINERESRIESHRRKARELQTSIDTNTQLVEKGRGQKLLESGALLGGFGSIGGFGQRRKRVKVGADFDVAKAKADIGFHERQIANLTGPAPTSAAAAPAAAAPAAAAPSPAPASRRREPVEVIVRVEDDLRIKALIGNRDAIRRRR